MTNETGLTGPDSSTHANSCRDGEHANGDHELTAHAAHQIDSRTVRSESGVIDEEIFVDVACALCDTSGTASVGFAEFTWDVDDCARTRCPPLEAGDCFAWDSGDYADGDVMYVEILEGLASFPPDADPFGHRPTGFRIRVHSCEDSDRGEKGVVGYYATDFVDLGCVRITREQMELARSRGWPRTHLEFLQLTGRTITPRHTAGSVNAGNSLQSDASPQPPNPEDRSKQQVLERVVTQLRQEILNLRRASRERGGPIDVHSALFDKSLDASPAVNRCRGFIIAVALVLKIPAGDVIRAASHAASCFLDGDERWAFEEIPF